MQKPRWLLDMKLAIIVAVANNGVIGYNGDMPWGRAIKDDLKRFKELTLGHPVIMGRKTYESIPEKFRPLPDRFNIVVSRLNDFRGRELLSVQSLEEAYAEAEKRDEFGFCIGGQSVYEGMLNMTQKINLTRIHESYLGDSYFPDFNFKGDWMEINRKDNQTENGIKYSFIDYERKIVGD